MPFFSMPQYTRMLWLACSASKRHAPKTLKTRPRQKSQTRLRVHAHSLAIHLWALHVSAFRLRMNRPRYNSHGTDGEKMANDQAPADNRSSKAEAMLTVLSDERE